MSPRKGLDKSIVIQAAADLLNREGAEALTLARLAETLGIQTPSLYNHVGGLPGLTRELNLRSIQELGERMAGAVIGYSGADAVRSAATYRAYIKENTGLYLTGLRSSAYQNPPDPELDQAQASILRIALAVLSSFQLAEQDALHAVRGLRALIHGFALLEVAGGFGLPVDCDESFNRLLDTYITGLSVARTASKKG
jgi:AcrR family transcriptional regulator